MQEEFKNMALKIADAIEERIKKEGRNIKKFGEELYIGADGTPTQYIDKIAEDVMFEIVDGKACVLSEEAGFVEGDSDYLFIVDPIDGTRNASHGIPFYCVSIAIGKKRVEDVEYAVVRNIPTGDTFMAEKGKGAFLNGERIYVDSIISDPIFSLVLGNSGNEKTWRHVRENCIRSLGAAALEMCLVASGAIHAYFMGNETLRVTDFAAGALIVREAGGEVYNASGEILDVELNLKERSSVLAVSSSKVMEVLL